MTTSKETNRNVPVYNDRRLIAVIFDTTEGMLDTLRFYREEGMITITDETLEELKQPIAGTILRAISSATEEHSH